jgi:hypothetical protein
MYQHDKLMNFRSESDFGTTYCKILKLCVTDLRQICNVYYFMFLVKCKTTEWWLQEICT